MENVFKLFWIAKNDIFCWKFSSVEQSTILFQESFVDFTLILKKIRYILRVILFFKSLDSGINKIIASSKINWNKFYIYFKLMDFISISRLQ